MLPHKHPSARENWIWIARIAEAIYCNDQLFIFLSACVYTESPIDFMQSGSDTPSRVKEVFSWPPLVRGAFNIECQASVACSVHHLAVSVYLITTVPPVLYISRLQQSSLVLVTMPKLNLVCSICCCVEAMEFTCHEFV